MIKRAFDFIIATIGLAILWPVFLVCAVFIWLEDGGPILFSQVRVGFGGKQFYIRKFRTMHAGKKQSGSSITVANDERITPIGKILRQMKLDELPQLINVLLGDMSLVGPRPEVPHLFLQYPKDLQIVMIGLRPGITDFASLEYLDENGLLKDVDDPEKIYLECILPRKSVLIKKYAKKISFLTDLNLITRTVLKLTR
jgi:lipopolysaccharide/colanic/teichoic acid biosynthesis glycosyltransferase